MEDRYYSMLATPEDISSTNIICRMLEGMGFRFYWVTKELTEETYDFLNLLK
jgi:hypothetical protein